MHKPYFLYTILFLFSVQQLSGQILTARLQDQATQEPVAFASVFFSKTSIGTTSDSSGYFRLNMRGLREVDLVISHLSYKIKSLKITDPSEMPEVIFLEPIETKLDEIVISSDHSPKRKKWLKRFEKALLGKSAKKNDTYILNPEVIVFSEKNKNLEAKGLDYLYVKNEALGYNIRFYIEDFTLYSNKDVVYAGKVFFEDLQDSVRNPRKLLKAREKTYNLSKNHFFQSLIQDSLRGTLYQIGETKFLEKLGTTSIRKLTYQDLKIERGLIDDTVYIDNYLTVVDKSAKSFWYVFKGENKFATSLIGSRSGKIIISPNGNILNPKEIEEIGFWAQQRLADLLPLDYQQTNITPEPSQLVLDSLSQFVQNRPQEKVYLHLNKPYYSKGEDIWLRAYLLDAKEHKASKLSKVIYAELINPAGKIIDSLMFHTKKGTWGKFSLKDSEQKGTYQVRAYTQYMRNQDERLFFQHPIEVYALAGDAISPSRARKEKRKSKKAKREIAKAHIENPPAFHMAFYPEGGDLVAGLESRVAYEIQNRPVSKEEMKLSILDQDGRVISQNLITADRVGSFSFTPQKNTTYFARINQDKNSYVFPLPEILPTGYTLNIQHRGADSLEVKINNTDDDDSPLIGAFLLGHVRGNISLLAEDLAPQRIIKIPKASLPAGVVHFTLFDKNGNPHAERLVFNEQGIKSDLLEVSQKTVKKIIGQEVELDFAINDTLLSAKRGSLSVSVTDRSLVQHSPYEATMVNYLYLNSDLGKPIQSPGMYTQSPDKLQRNQLDLILLTQGWRRFTWKEVFQAKKAPLYAAEQGYSISGYTALASDSTKKTRAQVMINSLGGQLFAGEMESDKEGNFTFDNLPHMDSTLYILQTRLQKSEKKGDEIKMKGRREVNVHLLPMERPEIQPLALDPDKPQDLIPWQTYVRDLQLADSLADLEIDLDEITITANQGFDSRLFDLYDLDKMDWVPNHTSAINLLSMIRSSFSYQHDRMQNKMFILKNIKGRLQSIPVTFVINDMLSSLLGFQALTADVISYIGFFGDPMGSVVYIKTRANGPRSLEQELEKGILDYMHPGYNLAREFYQPISQKLSGMEASRLQSAIHWEPNLVLDEKGTTSLKFELPNRAGLYQVRVEGITGNGLPVFKLFDVELE